MAEFIFGELVKIHQTTIILYTGKFLREKSFTFTRLRFIGKLTISLFKLLRVNVMEQINMYDCADTPHEKLQKLCGRCLLLYWLASIEK